MMAQKDPRIAMLARALTMTAHQGGGALGLTHPQVAEAAAMFLAAFAAGNAIKGKEADAVKAIAEVVATFSETVDRIQRLEAAEFPPGVKPH